MFYFSNCTQTRFKKPLEFCIVIGTSLTTGEIGSPECSFDHIGEKELAAASYIDSLAESISDKISDEREYLVPLFPKLQVYDQFCKEIKTLYIETAPSFSYFNQIRVHHKSNIRAQRHSHFARCSNFNDVDAAR